MGKTWQKIVVLLLGFSLVFGFAIGAVLGGGPDTQDQPAGYSPPAPSSSST